MKKKLRSFTLGCSKNTVDTEHLLSSLEGVFEVVDTFPADVAILNTCGFIGDAKQESIEAILELVEAKKRGEVAQIVVFGCLSQRYGEELREQIPEVDAWFGARGLEDIVEFFGAKPSPGRYITAPGVPYAYLKISEGCDRRCSYCAIPFIRGAHRSTPVSKLIREAQLLSQKGIKELEIIAQDTTYYGMDTDGRRTLAPLLRSLCGVRGIEWLRIHYSYPADFPEDVLDEMASNPHICKYLDIPLQHISDGVLKRMHRGVDGKWTRELISRLRERIPGVVLRTTMIVGFPGETREDFQELLDFVKWARFERLGAFMYSEEEGTWGALHLKEDVPAEEKQRRLDALMELQSEISMDYNLSRVGTEVTVLADSFRDGVLVCRSQGESPDVDGEILVCGADESRVGEFLNVRITGADCYDLQAEIIL